MRERLALGGRIVAPLAHEVTVGAQVSHASIGQADDLCHRLPAGTHAVPCHLVAFPLREDSPVTAQAKVVTSLAPFLRLCRTSHFADMQRISAP
jgi:hypothetical protein